MKITLAAVTAITGLVVAPAAFGAVTEYKSTLNAAQADCATKSKATGTAALSYDDANGKFTGTITLVPNGDLLTVSDQHLHDGLCGVSGGVNTALPAPASNVIKVDDTIAMPDRADFLKSLNAGSLYINIHSGVCGGGEIRGQVYPKASAAVCPAGGTDAGTDSGTSSSGGSSGTTSSSGGSSGTTSSSGGSSGATTERPDSGDGTSGAAAEDDSGCSTSGSTSSSSNGALVAIGLGVALAGFARGRKKR